MKIWESGSHTTQAEMEEILARIVGDAVKLAGAENGIIHVGRIVYDKYENSYSARYPDPDKDTQRAPRPDGITYEIMQCGEVLKFGETDESTREVEPSIRASGILGMIGIPLKDGAEQIGALFLNFKESHKVSEEEVARLHILAGLAAKIITTAQYASVVNVLYNAAEVIIRDTSLPKRLDEIAKQAVHIVTGSEFRGDCFSHVALKKEDGIDYIASSSREVFETFQRKKRAGCTDSGGIAEYVVRHGRPIYCIDVNAKDSKGHEHYVETEDAPFVVQSQLSVPVKNEHGDTIGAISVEHSDLDAFTAEDQTSLVKLSTIAAIAIENARDFEEQQERLDETVRKLEVYIDENYQQAREQSSRNYILSLGASLIGIVLILLGALLVLGDRSALGGLLGVLSGVLAQTITILAFRRTDTANIRMDNLHRERFEVDLFNNLLAASDQMTDESVKRNIIELAADRWLGQTTLTNSTDTTENIN